MTVASTPFGLTTISAWQHDTVLMIGFDSTNHFSYLNGAYLEATVITEEIQPDPGHRVKIDFVRPLVDSNPSTITPTVSLGCRARLRDAVIYTSPVAINAWGISPTNSDTRYLRIEIVVPASSDWRHIEGAVISIAETTAR